MSYIAIRGVTFVGDFIWNSLGFAYSSVFIF